MQNKVAFNAPFSQASTQPSISLVVLLFPTISFSFLWLLFSSYSVEMDILWSSNPGYCLYFLSEMIPF